MFYPAGLTVLLHNRAGLRAELNFHERGRLDVWVSPGAGRSLDYRDRNFSCRDDACSLFDRITFPALSEKGFVRCDYDPFEAALIWKRGVSLHVRMLAQEAGLVVWFGKGGMIDLKSDKQDRVLERSDEAFVVEHPDRHHRMKFAAVVGSGGRLINSPVHDEGRSAYARAVLDPGRLLVLAASAEEDEPADALARRVAARPVRALCRAEEQAIAPLLMPGRFVVGDDRMQRLLDVSRRVLVAMQDASGAVRAAMNRIYYLIWVRDGSIIACGQAYAGRRGEIERWTRFLLANPTVVRDEEPAGRMFGMLVNPVTKWEEDGAFYAVWSAFCAWTQSGDDAWRDPERVGVLDEAMDWLDRRCFDSERNLYGRYFACESPFHGSRDAGFDNAVGSATGPSELAWKGRLVRRSYDLYVNLGGYAACVMLAALRPERADYWMNRARNLAGAVAPLLDSDRPAYGWLECEGAPWVLAKGSGLDLTDYVWGLTLPPFSPQPWIMPGIRRRLLERARTKPKGWFLAGYFALLSSLDPLWIEEGAIVRAMRYAAKQCYRPGAFLPMPNTVVEMLEIEDGDIWHDVRPQAFSIGPWLASVVGLGLRRLPFGWAARPSRFLKEVRGLEWGAASIDVSCGVRGGSHDLVVNGTRQTRSWQIPECLWQSGTNKVEWRRAKGAKGGPLWVESSLRLAAVAETGDQVEARAESFGCNHIAFRGLRRQDAVEIEVAGRTVQGERHRCPEMRELTFVTFEGRGPTRVTWRR